jgi:hypothetical protein
VVTQASADAWIAELEQRSDEGRFLVTWVRFEVLAAKPAAPDDGAHRSSIGRRLRELGARARVQLWFARVRARHAARRLVTRRRP